MYRSLPVVARELKATEDVLDAVYDAARRGLKGDNLAFAANLLPEEYRRLCVMDPLVQVAEAKGRADAEALLSGVMMEAAAGGDAKVALEILKHKHDWVATQRVEMEGSQQISITVALEKAAERVERSVIDVTGT
jgi:hypothetical protein